jgi:hypothetical protein
LQKKIRGDWRRLAGFPFQRFGALTIYLGTTLSFIALLILNRVYVFIRYIPIKKANQTGEVRPAFGLWVSELHTPQRMKSTLTTYPASGRIPYLMQYRVSR